MVGNNYLFAITHSQLNQAYRRFLAGLDVIPVDNTSIISVLLCLRGEK
ncbi:hypothetical protein [Anabaena azotica]|nr:hypothetical protein [Anabaena azotica]